ncbi:MAG: B12-binding domain-containing radical SAM protein, partial [Candidatus Tectimicrobiota bacterium]
MPRSTVLLLNPPGNQRIMRDYFCSKVSKASYYYHPVDLLFLSGWLGDHYHVRVLDAVVQGLGPRATVAYVKTLRPAAVVALTSAPSFVEDEAIFRAIKHNGSPRLLVTGDLVLEHGEDLLRTHREIDGVLLDFSTPDILDLLEGRPKQNAIYRDGNGAVVTTPVTRERGVFAVPRPQHELFPLEAYRFILARRRHFATVLSDFGCPYPCQFCISGHLGFKLRDLDGVMEEIEHLHRLGLREIFFRDQTFGVHKKRTLELCSLLASYDPRFGWVCFSRTDVLDEELLEGMQAAGCHTIIFGLETVNHELLAGYGKAIPRETTEATLQACARRGVRTLGTFILGLPGEDEAAVRRTIRWATELPLDFATFNVA